MEGGAGQREWEEGEEDRGGGEIVREGVERAGC